MDDFFYDDEINLIEENFKEKIFTHKELSSNLVGQIKDLQPGYARIEFEPSTDMFDENEKLFSGFLFNAASYAAIMSINEENALISSAKTIFYRPATKNDVIIFEAISRHKESKKKAVRVTGKHLGEKIFDGEFYTLVYDQHVLDVKLYDRKADQKTKDDD